MNKNLQNYLVCAGIAVAVLFVTFRLMPESIRKVIIGS